MRASIIFLGTLFIWFLFPIHPVTAQDIPDSAQIESSHVLFDEENNREFYHYGFVPVGEKLYTVHHLDDEKGGEGNFVEVAEMNKDFVVINREKVQVNEDLRYYKQYFSEKNQMWYLLLVDLGVSIGGSKKLLGSKEYNIIAYDLKDRTGELHTGKIRKRVRVSEFCVSEGVAYVAGTKSNNPYIATLNLSNGQSREYRERIKGKGILINENTSEENEFLYATKHRRDKRRKLRTYSVENEKLNIKNTESITESVILTDKDAVSINGETEMEFFIYSNNKDYRKKTPYSISGRTIMPGRGIALKSEKGYSYLPFEDVGSYNELISKFESLGVNAGGINYYGLFRGKISLNPTVQINSVIKKDNEIHVALETFYPTYVYIAGMKGKTYSYFRRFISNGFMLLAFNESGKLLYDAALPLAEQQSLYVNKYVHLMEDEGRYKIVYSDNNNILHSIIEKDQVLFSSDKTYLADPSEFSKPTYQKDFLNAFRYWYDDYYILVHTYNESGFRVVFHKMKPKD